MGLCLLLLCVKGRAAAFWANRLASVQGCRVDARIEWSKQVNVKTSLSTFEMRLVIDICLEVTQVNREPDGLQKG